MVRALIAVTRGRFDAEFQLITVCFRAITPLIISHATIHEIIAAEWINRDPYRVTARNMYERRHICPQLRIR